MVTLEAFTTLVTRWFLSFLMNSYMLVKICFLSKRLSTKGFRTQKWAFSRVHPQMIEKIMPFPEKHFTVAKVTFKQFDVSLRPRVLVLKNSKLSRWRNLLLNFDCVKVEIGTVLDLYFSSSWNFVSNCCFFNLITGHNDVIGIKRIWIWWTFKVFLGSTLNPLVTFFRLIFLSFESRRSEVTATIIIITFVVIT